MFNWDKMTPRAGYYAERKHDVHNVYSSIVFGLRAPEHAQVIQYDTLQQLKEPTAAQVAAQKRLLGLLRAFAAYLNAGGSPAEAEAMLKACNVSGGLVFPGWTYFDCGLSETGNAVHEFANPDYTRFVRWVQNEYILTGLNADKILEE